VEFEGGGEETRSNKWLAELQQDMFVEISPADAAERGIRDGAWVLVSGRKCGRQGDAHEGAGHRACRKGVAWMPFHFAGWFQNVDQRGSIPRVRSDRARREREHGSRLTIDPVTGMQEPKATLFARSRAA